MLSPKKTKYRKQFKGRIHGASKGNTALHFGSYGLKALEPERITARQIEAARRAITRQMKRQGHKSILENPILKLRDLQMIAGQMQVIIHKERGKLPPHRQTVPLAHKVAADLDGGVGVCGRGVVGFHPAT